jgi:uncharacterized membrane protein YeiB
MGGSKVRLLSFLSSLLIAHFWTLDAALFGAGNEIILGSLARGKAFPKLYPLRLKIWLLRHAS